MQAGKFKAGFSKFGEQRRPDASEDDNGADSEGQSSLQIWIEEHKYVIYGAVATGAAAVAALFWATRRR